jgi:hypothetical protein
MLPFATGPFHPSGLASASSCHGRQSPHGSPVLVEVWAQPYEAGSGRSTSDKALCDRGVPTSMTNAGYIRLHRALLDHPIFAQLAPIVLKVWIACLLRANWRESKWYDGQSQVAIPAGAFAFSQGSLSKLCGVSRQELRTALNHLVGLGCITIQATNHYSLLSVVNWESYQSSEATEQPTINQRSTIKSTNGLTNGSTNGIDSEVIGNSGTCGVQADTANQQINQRVNHRVTQNLTTEEEVRSKNTTTCAGAAAPLELVSLDPNAKPRKPGAKPKPYQDVLQEVSRSIHARHPAEFRRRNLSEADVMKRLEAILKYRCIPAAEAEACLRRIDRNHAAACESEGWRKDGGQFAKGLRNYLSPREGEYDIEPTTAVARKEPVRLMA